MAAPRMARLPSQPACTTTRASAHKTRGHCKGRRDFAGKIYTSRGTEARHCKRRMRVGAHKPVVATAGRGQDTSARCAMSDKTGDSERRGRRRRRRTCRRRRRRAPPGGSPSGTAAAVAGAKETAASRVDGLVEGRVGGRQRSARATKAATRVAISASVEDAEIVILLSRG